MVFGRPLVVLCALLIAACDSPERPHATLDLIWEHGSEAPAFYRVLDVATDRDGILYAPDDKAGIVHRFDQDGEYLDSFGGLGDGPGEFSRGAGVIAISDSGQIAVIDKAGFELHFFGPDLQFQRSHRLPGLIVGDATYRSDGTLLIAGATRAGGALIAVLDTTGNPVELFPLRSGFEERGVFWERSKIAIQSSGKLVVQYQFSNRVEILDSEGAIEKAFPLGGMPSEALPSTLELPPGVAFGFPKGPPPGSPVVVGVSTDSRDRIYLLLNGDLGFENKKREIRILNSEGVHIETLVLPKATSFVYLDAQDNLIVFSGPNLAKYRINHDD